MLRFFLALALSLFSSSLSLAQDSSALINKALDEQVKVALNKPQPLPQALELITQQTGVRLEADPVIWDLLPWGQDTSISATIEHKTLREALEAITRKLGLTFTLKEEAVAVEPLPALRRLARRASVNELQALDTVASNRLDLNNTRPTIKELLEAVDKKLADLKSPFAIENRSAGTVKQEQQLNVPRNATLLDALESLPKETSATWYPWGKTLVVTTKEDRVRAQLERTMTVRYNAVDVLQVLMELSARSGVRFDIQSGAVAAIPPESRTIRAVFENASIRQILEAVAGSTGLSYTVTDDSVKIENPLAGRAGPLREPNFGIIQLDIGIQVLVPQSQVPPDLREFIKYRTKKELDRMHKMMEDEGFKPATQPATKPANQDL